MHDSRELQVSNADRFCRCRHTEPCRWLWRVNVDICLIWSCTLYTRAERQKPFRYITHNTTRHVTTRIRHTPHARTHSGISHVVCVCVCVCVCVWAGGVERWVADGFFARANTAVSTTCPLPLQCNYIDNSSVMLTIVQTNLLTDSYNYVNNRCRC